jgi:hypothetical protein
MHGMRAKHNKHGDVYWFEPPESKTLRLVLGGVVLLNGDMVATHVRSRIGLRWSWKMS